jgi:hypothetical protein
MSMSLQEFRKNINDIASGKSGFTQIADTLISVYTLGGSNLLNRGIKSIGKDRGYAELETSARAEAKLKKAGYKEEVTGMKESAYEKSMKETIKLIITSDDEGNVNVNANKSGPKVKIAQGIQTVGG